MNRQSRRQGNLYENYGNMGSRVFKRGYKIRRKKAQELTYQKEIIGF